MKKLMAVMVIMVFAAVSAFAQDSGIIQRTEKTVDDVAKTAGSTADAVLKGTERTAQTAVTGTADVAKTATEVVTGRKKGADTFNVYTEKYDVKNHYIPSGWMGDYGDIRTDDGCRVTPYDGKTCLKITYTAKGSQGAGWMGIFWQNPANNWGSQMGGYDLTGYNKLVFFARGEKGGEVISEFKVGGINGEYSDSDSTSIGPVTLTKDWKEYEIDLKGLDLSYISGGFMMSASSADNPDGFTIYLDDIQYVK